MRSTPRLNIWCWACFSANVCTVYCIVAMQVPRTLEYMDVPHSLFKCNFSAGTVSVNVKYSPIPGAWQRFLAILSWSAAMLLLLNYLLVLRADLHFLGCFLGREKDYLHTY